MNLSRAAKYANDFLDQYSKQVPGIQYALLDADRIILEYAGGWADIQNKKRLLPNMTLMAYSMTKTFTAAAILQLAEKGRLGLDDELHQYLPDTLYEQSISVRQLMSHTAGIPNPIPLRWIHLAEEHEVFDEKAALAQVLRDYPRLEFAPGSKHAYSNIGYWLLGQVIEQVTMQNYTTYLSEGIFKPLGLEAREMAFVVSDASSHAKGYLAKYSIMNLVKGLVTDKKVWGSYEGQWLNLKSHYVNGPAFGGLVGSGRAFGRFLQDQLRESSVLFNPETKRLFYTQQTNNRGEPVGMTLGWHIGDVVGTKYYFKEGGGGGFHSEMRIYPIQNLATVVMVNCTDFNSNAFLSRLDKPFLEQYPT